MDLSGALIILSCFFTNCGESRPRIISRYLRRKVTSLEREARRHKGVAGLKPSLQPEGTSIEELVRSSELAASTNIMAKENSFLSGGVVRPPQRKTIVVLGEVLWDIFQDAIYLGGAPLNFAANIQRL